MNPKEAIGDMADAKEFSMETPVEDIDEITSRCTSCKGCTSCTGKCIGQCVQKCLPPRPGRG